MRNIFLALFCFYACVSNAQIVIDKNLKSRFEESKKEFPNAFQEIIKECEEHENFSGYVLFTLFNEDTLNIEEIKFPDYSNITVTILSLDGIPVEEEINPEREELEHSDKTIMLAGSYLSGDTLAVKIGFPFGHEYIDFKIHENLVQTTYSEWYKDDNVLKLNPSDTLTDELIIPILLQKLELSSTDFQLYKTIYGYCEFETFPYFRIEHYLDEQALKLIKKLKFYFKVKIGSF